MKLYSTRTRASAEVSRLSIQKQPVLGILHHPLQTLLQVQSSDCATLHDTPFVRADAVEMKSLCLELVLNLPFHHLPRLTD